MLSNRRQQVLSALIREYVASALPVASKALTERYGLGVSSATIRNELSILEEAGYITQPHTSAGRIPTDDGYRVFVDELLKQELNDETMRDDALLKQIKAQANEVDELIEKTSEAVSKLTDCLSIVLPPSPDEISIKLITLVALNSRRASLIVLTHDGQVKSRTIEFSHDFKPEDLASAQLFLNEIFAGKDLRISKEEYLKLNPACLQDPFLHVIVDEFFTCIQEGDAAKSHSLGLSKLLNKPEFDNPQALLPVMNLVEDDTHLLHILSDRDQELDTIVKIGHENKTAELQGVSVVATEFGKGNSTGFLAVIGPTRMDYSQVIRAVRAARQNLSDI